MDTNSPALVAPVADRGPYRHHSHEFKRAVVEETFHPGAASVARIARHHGINANQVFKWRRAFRDGSLDGESPALLPVQVVHGSMAGSSVPARVRSIVLLAGSIGVLLGGSIGDTQKMGSMILLEIL